MENENIKVGFVSLGCSKNLVDTEVMLYRLNEAGYSITADETEADVVIINTCAFIESAKTEASGADNFDFVFKSFCLDFFFKGFDNCR